ncbi:diadenosine tetraphosphate hydrolase [Vibrio ishigakensis]|uniref:Diadenosine tetraphosphate hydrolase n=1 Tax=Vibrio ishigakensis TaxID=1481914 RepID=A0A0B8PEP7_9VIBR|nr:diadenosine tetraphosphate hydrolase [Vibrio ishigakensis]
MPFSLHPQLAKDTDVLGHFPLSIALLHKDSAVPWIILVPKIEGLKEIHHMSVENQQAFMQESQVVMEALESLFSQISLTSAR